MYFDSHTHYDDRKFKYDRHELIKSLPENGVDYVVNIGADMESSRRSIELAAQYDFIYAAVGVHPHEAKELDEEKFTELEKLCGAEKVVALGEIGLDFYYDNSPRETQRYWFARQLELAKRTGLPVVIHSRDASEETYRIIEESDLERAVIHCYSGSREMAEKYVAMGHYLGVGGVITFDNARKLVETVEAVSLDKILIETDCPYLSPNPKRGKRNDSTNLVYVVERIAEIKKVTPQEVAETTKRNAIEFYKIK